MQCPICTNVALVMSERQGIEIDYCPQCRGVWLDRGELDKIIERSLGASATAKPQRGGQTEPAPAGGHYQEVQRKQSHYKDEHHKDEHYQQGYYKKKKRESFLSDLFGF